ncbi:MAG: hypothetical protein H6P99_1166 [Holophagaceae bacterium]|nr:hypothetical protein [Holophagaceae bacterium]
MRLSTMFGEFDEMDHQRTFKTLLHRFDTFKDGQGRVPGARLLGPGS